MRSGPGGPGPAARIVEVRTESAPETKQVAARLHDIRPDILLSVDAHPLDPALMLQGQDSVRWAQEGLIDLVVDMRYNRVLDRATMDRVYEAIGTPNRLAIMLADYDKIGDEIVARDPALLVKYVELVRAKWPGAGIGMSSPSCAG